MEITGKNSGGPNETGRPLKKIKVVNDRTMNVKDSFVPGAGEVKSFTGCGGIDIPHPAYKGCGCYSGCGGYPGCGSNQGCGSYAGCGHYAGCGSNQGCGSYAGCGHYAGCGSNQGCGSYTGCGGYYIPRYHGC